MSVPPTPFRPRLLTGPRIVGFVAALAVGGLVVLQLRSGEYASLASWKDRLATVAAERTLLIETWVREREKDALALASLPIARELVGAPAGVAPGPARAELLRRHLRHACASYGYADVTLLDAAGRLIASCSDRAPPPETVRWALGSATSGVPLVDPVDLGTEGPSLRFASPVAAEPAGEEGGDGPAGILVVTTKPLGRVLGLPLRIGGTRTGRIEVRTVPPEDDPAVIQVTAAVLGGTRFLVAKVRRSEALAAVWAAALSQGFVAVVAILLPLLLATVGWQRERSKALRETLARQQALLDARAYAESIVQSIDAVVWEAEREEPGSDEGLGSWRFSFVSRRVESVLGSPTEAWLGHDKLWLESVLPGDRPRVAQFYDNVTVEASQEGSIEFRAQRSDGTEVWLRDRVIAVSDEGRVRRLRGVLVDVTQRVQAERDTAALLAVARDVGGSRDRRELFARVQRRTTEVLPCDRVVTFLLDPERNVLRVVAHYGLLPERVAAVEGLEFEPGRALGGRVLAGETVVINDVREQAWLPIGFYRGFGVNALIAAPLYLGGRPAGALVALTVEPKRGAFAERQATLLEGIARQLAVGLEVVRHHEQQTEESLVSTALGRASRELIASPSEPEALLAQLCRVTVETLGCDVGHVILQRPGEDTLAVVASDGASPEELAVLAALRLPSDVAAPFLEELRTNGLACLEAGHASDHGAFERLRGALGVETLLCLPLRLRDGQIGIHCAGHREATVLSGWQLRTARGLAEIGSTVFDRARLVAELERANRVRSDFIATMSHELRTPLHIILGYEEMLLDGGVGKLTAEQQETLQRCHRSARTLLELVNATLDLSRLESTAVAPASPPVDVESIVEEAVGEAGDLSKKSEVSLAIEHAGRLPPLPVDPVKLKVIVKNLVGNAIKFTDRGSVLVRTSEADGGVAVTVSDPGIGIPKDALALIFEPFRQVDSSNTRRHGGVGLGLHIVQRLAGSLGGRISVDSEVGHGSTFRLWLPNPAAEARGRAA